MWKSLDGLGLDVEMVKALKKLLKDRMPKHSEKRDVLIWAAFNDGKYNVKDGYRVILGSQELEKVDIPLKLCWDTSCLPKARFFLWLAIQNRILTMDRLYKLGI